MIPQTSGKCAWKAQKKPVRVKQWGNPGSGDKVVIRNLPEPYLENRARKRAPKVFEPGKHRPTTTCRAMMKRR